MSDYALLVPKTENPPAKVKDPGVINMVKAGDAAYNAKSGEVLFLPRGEARRRDLASALRRALFEACGIQPVDCGSDRAILSVAERFAREYGKSAMAFCEERGRILRVLSWNRDGEAARGRAAAIMAAVADVLGNGGFNRKGREFSFVPETTRDGGESFSLLSVCGAGSIGARQGVFCAECHKMLLPDSPYNFTPTESDEPMEEMEDIETTGSNTIAALRAQLGVDETRTVKAMLYAASDLYGESGKSGEPRAVAAFVRGDHNVSMNKLSAWVRDELGMDGLHTATSAEVERLIGEVAGYCGPIGMPRGVSRVADRRLAGARNMIAGANRPGFHRKGCCHPRDFDPTLADIASVASGMNCQCGGTFESSYLRESGAVRFGAEDGEDLKALAWRDRDGTREYPAICSAVLSLESLLLAMAEG
jgi:prolyl-tRNA synthetase